MQSGNSGNSTLTTLIFGGNHIGDQGTERLATALERNSTLTTLDLFDSGIGNQGKERLATALQRNKAGFLVLTISLQGIGTCEQSSWARYLSPGRRYLMRYQILGTS